MFQTEHPSGLSPDIFTHYFSHHSKEDLIFMSDIKTTFSSRSMASSPSLWPTITCSELSCSRTTRYLPASLPPCSTYFHQKSLLWRSRILSCLVNPLTTKPFLDIRVVLNQNTLINLEMQVINEHNWPERSLSYLYREFDQLSSSKPEPGRNCVYFFKTMII